MFDKFRELYRNNRIVILMQSAPGAGKSTLANEIKSHFDDMWGCDPVYNSIICSADDYFISPYTKQYKFDSAQLYNAHSYCKSVFQKAVEQKYSVIIIDNTNVDLKAIRNYYDVNNGYKYLIVRPNTPWYFDAEECFKKNTHNVPLETIERMINSIKKFSLEEVKADILWI